MAKSYQICSSLKLDAERHEREAVSECPRPLYPKPLGTEDKRRLDELYTALSEASRSHAGYPCNLLFDYSELYRFLKFSLNNVGDPFHDSNFRINTHGIEREMIDVFARLTAAPEGGYWGYVNHGGTEGNMYGLYLARELIGERSIVYFSEDTHYSVAKILRVLNMRHIMIKADGNGEMDYQDFRETIRIHRDSPPVVMVNVGTTMTGAVDNVETIRGILNEFAIPRFYIHCDAALSGLVLPFIDNPPPFDFAAGIDSIAISGHKLIGSPFPCGVVLAKREYVNLIARGIEYVGALDTTLSGSRNAFGPLVLWYAFKRYGTEGFRDLVQGSLRRADYAIEKFKENGVPAWRNRNSITVVFPRPSQETIRNRQLAAKGDIAHIITLPHLENYAINSLAEEVAADLKRCKEGKQ